MDTTIKWNIKLLLLFILSFQLQSISIVKGLNIGLHFGHSAVSMQCSRTCESEHCSLPPFLRYGKYCGVLYTGCPGEEPCDGLDECCRVHDACIQENHKFRDTGAKTFQGNECKPEEVVDEISIIIQVALLTGRAIDNP
ncbi:putative phospholipase A(2) [Dioscorea sansibarensis]